MNGGAAPFRSCYRVVGDRLWPRFCDGDHHILEALPECAPGEEMLVVTMDGETFVAELTARAATIVTLRLLVGGTARRLPLAKLRQLAYVAGVARSAVYPIATDVQS